MPGAKIIGGITRSSSVNERINHFKKGHKQNASPTSPLSPESISSASPDHTDNSIDQFLCLNKTLESSNDIIESSKEMPPCPKKSLRRRSMDLSSKLKVLPSIRSKAERTSKTTPPSPSGVGSAKEGISSTTAPPSPSPSPSGVGSAKEGISRTTTPVSPSPSSVGPAKEGIRSISMKKISQKPPVNGKRNMLKKSISSLSSGCSPYIGRNSNYQKVIEVEDGIKGSNNPHMGPYLLKKARGFLSTGDTKKAFEFAIRAKKSFENCVSKGSNLDYVMCLHVLASMYWCSGEVNEAISLLERSIEIPNIKLGQDHALAKFVGCMRLGDIYAMLGHIEKSILLYESALQVQKQVLGEEDPRFGETCRYVAEAHVQSFQFDEAERLCQLALNIDNENDNCPASIGKAANRRLMGLICDSKGKYEDALQHFILARPTICTNGLDSDISALDCSIGDMYLALARYEEAIFSYQKALSSLKRSKEENHPAIAAVFVHLAELYNKVGKFSESKSYCEKAFQIYSNPPLDSNTENIANGLVDLATIYESMNELDRAIELLQKALEMYDDQPSEYCTIAGIEAQMGVIYFMLGKHVDSYNLLKRSISKFQVSGATKSSLYAITMNQLGLTCVQLREISEAAKHFEEAMTILEKEYGPCHPDTLGVYNNLAASYEDLERWDDAIDLLEYVVVMREEMLGTADPIVDDEKRRLEKLLKQTGRVRRRNSRSLETLLDNIV